MNTVHIFKNLQLADLLSPLNNKTVHVKVSAGKAWLSQEPWEESEAHVTDCIGSYISQGMLDLSFGLPDPGMEHRESFSSASNLALESGFTYLCCLPNTIPVVDNKTAVLYTLRQNSTAPITFLPLAALSKKLKGEELAELYDMYMAGAVAFSSAEKAPLSDALLLKALEYSQNMAPLVFYFPFDPTLSKGGMVHESNTTAGLGLKGLAPISEYIPLQKAIELVRYAGTQIHITGISCNESVEIIRKAKKEGLPITCDVPALNLLFTENELKTFDTSFKLLPPLRDKKHQNALIEGLLDGTIDAISSGHRPLDPEVKEVEFLYAEYGAATLQSIWVKLLEVYGSKLGVDLLSSKLSREPAKVVGIEMPLMNEGELDAFIITNLNTKWKLLPSNSASLSLNSPFMNVDHTGKVYAVFNKSKLHILQTSTL